MTGCVLAVDVGGTFTDLALADVASRRLWTAKTPTTPGDPSLGVAQGVASLLGQAGRGPGEVLAVLHGSTVATNLLIERKGSPPALLTTRGCRYVLHIGRHDVPRGAHMYLWVKPPRLVAPEHIWEVTERLDHRGRVEEPLDEPGAVAVLRALREQGLPAIAVSLLHAYANPVHEERLRALCAAHCPGTPLSLSCEVLPQFREYERTTATVLNAYLLPHAGRYYGRLQGRMAALGLRAPLSIMKSSGGMASAAAAAARPVLTVLSGPAAGVVGALAVAQQTGHRRCISVDVGGTSADVALARDGRPGLTTEGEIGDLPLSFPMVDVRSIGAGGGSIARLTPEGGLRVGPDSAGAEPGPVCYGRGGADPTVTDAHLVLGRLGEALLGGALPLDRARARAAIEARIARPLGLTVEAAASGILEILDTHMAGAIRAVSVERGHDPREFALVASGGAGGLHAGRLAALLGIPVAVVPRHAGVLSTLGLLASEIRNDYVRTLRQGPGAWDLAQLEAAYADLAGQARAWLAGEGVPEADRRLERSADLRYVHQGYELTVPVPAGPLTPAAVGAIEAAFHRLHEQLYTYATPEAPVELVNVRVAALGPAWGLAPGPLPAGPLAGTGPREHRPVYFSAAGGWVDCPVWDAGALGPGVEIPGPAILAQDLATVVVEPGHRARVDPHGHVLLHLPGHGG